MHSSIPGLKSWPHCEQQCTSSITSLENLSLAYIFSNLAIKRLLLESFSGVQYRSLRVVVLAVIASWIFFTSCLVLLAFSIAASSPSLCSAINWSSIRDTSGDTTRVTPVGKNKTIRHTIGDTTRITAAGNNITIRDTRGDTTRITPLGKNTTIRDTRGDTTRITPLGKNTTIRDTRGDTTRVTHLGKKNNQRHQRRYNLSYSCR